MAGRRYYPRVAPEAMSIQDTARLLGVSVTTIRRWIRRKFIVACRVGPQLIRIPRSEIVRMRRLRVHYEQESERPVYPQV